MKAIQRVKRIEIDFWKIYNADMSLLKESAVRCVLHVFTEKLFGK
jgi:hypothetical protein